MGSKKRHTARAVCRLIAASLLASLAATACEEPDKTLEGDCMILARALCRHACECTPDNSGCAYFTAHAEVEFENRKECLWREANLFCRELADRIDVVGCYEAIQNSECVEGSFSSGLKRPAACTEMTK